MEFEMKPADADHSPPHPDYRSGCGFEGRSPQADHSFRSLHRSGPTKGARIRVQLSPRPKDIQSRKCAINNFWTKNPRGLLG